MFSFFFLSFPSFFFFYLLYVTDRDDDSRDANDGRRAGRCLLFFSTYLLIDRYIATVSHSIRLLLITRLHVEARCDLAVSRCGDSRSRCISYGPKTRDVNAKKTSPGMLRGALVTIARNSHVSRNSCRSASRDTE